MVSIFELRFINRIKIKGKILIDFINFYNLINGNKLSKWLETLPVQIAIWKKKSSQKHFKKWRNSVKFLPEIKPYKVDLKNSVTALSKFPLNKGEKLRIEKLMRNLIPWRKGPFSLYGVNIDSEWQSDWKWKRVLPHLSNLVNKTVLDVGCGNGYYLWRMIGEDARLVVGIDPTPLFFFQFEAIHKLLGENKNHRAYLIPIGIETMPSLSAFDTVFSMGILYHRRSPLEHLWDLKKQLVSGGELVLETLAIEGDERTVLVPKDSYGRMRNVYFIPSILALKNWLIKCGYVNVYVADVHSVKNEEQRYTEWVTQSKKNLIYLQRLSKKTDDYSKSIRVVIIATKP